MERLQKHVITFLFGIFDILKCVQMNFKQKEYLHPRDKTPCPLKGWLLGDR
jgi:hypothetical protein